MIVAKYESYLFLHMYMPIDPYIAREYIILHVCISLFGILIYN